MLLLLGLKQEKIAYQDNQGSIDGEESIPATPSPMNIEDTVLRTLTIRKGKCPEEDRGIYHKLLSLAWYPRKIETVLETDDEDLLYLFYVCCVSRSVRKRRCNEYSRKKKLSLIFFYVKIRSFPDPDFS